MRSQVRVAVIVYAVVPLVAALIQGGLLSIPHSFWRFLRSPAFQWVFVVRVIFDLLIAASKKRPD